MVNSPGSASRAPRVQREFDYVAQYHGRAVSRNFDDVVGSVGVGRGEIKLRRLRRCAVLTLIVWPRATRPRVAFGTILRAEATPIAGESPATTWFHELTKHRSPGFKFMLQAQHGCGDVPEPQARRCAPPRCRLARGVAMATMVSSRFTDEIVAGESGASAARYARVTDPFPRHMCSPLKAEVDHG